MVGMLQSSQVYLLVFVRLGGMIGFNPLLSRRNLPAMARVGLILTLTLLLAPQLIPAGGGTLGSLDLVMAMIRELLLGLVLGFVFQIFYYLLFFVGDLMDTQFGMSMAKVFDPGTNVQMSISGNLLTIVFCLYLFATDSHLLLIQIFAQSFAIIPPGEFTLTVQVASVVLELFVAVFDLAMRLAIPFIAAQLILEMSMGVLMKLIPQIHVFVINIQFKMLLGILLLLLFAGPITSFLSNYLELMFENIQGVLELLR